MLLIPLSNILSIWYVIYQRISCWYHYFPFFTGSSVLFCDRYVLQLFWIFFLLVKRICKILSNFSSVSLFYSRMEFMIVYFSIKSFSRVDIHSLEVKTTFWELLVQLNLVPSDKSIATFSSSSNFLTLFIVCISFKRHFWKKLSYDWFQQLSIVHWLDDSFIWMIIWDIFCVSCTQKDANSCDVWFSV